MIKINNKKLVLVILLICLYSMGILILIIGLIIELFGIVSISFVFILFGTLLSFIYYSEFIVKKHEKEQKREFKNKLKRGAESLDHKIDKILKDVEYKN